MESTTGQTYDDLARSVANRGVNLEDVEERLRAQRVETPSWGYGDTGTRFAVFPQKGVPRDAFEKMADAAQVHGLTGICPSVAIHIPWDRVDDYGELKGHAGYSRFFSFRRCLCFNNAVNVIYIFMKPVKCQLIKYI